MFDNFTAFNVEVETDVKIHGLIGGSGPAILLVHGFPESLIIWADVAEQLAASFAVIAIDLRGYGKSSKPISKEDHSTYSKRRMALDCIKVMDNFDIKKFYFLGHDRGARVGHRLCLDHGNRVIKAIFLDIAPTLDMYESTNFSFAAAYYHWFFLIQPAPLPESLITANPTAFIQLNMSKTLGATSSIKDENIEEFISVIAKPEGASAMCEDYRASASIDLEHDREDIKLGNKITVPLKVLWGKQGVIEKNFDALKLWKNVATEVTGECVDSGHYIPEEIPDTLLEHISFFK